MQTEYFVEKLLCNAKGKSVNHCLFSAKLKW
jgi:hypothetical protein